MERTVFDKNILFFVRIILRLVISPSEGTRIGSIKKVTCIITPATHIKRVAGKFIVIIQIPSVQCVRIAVFSADGNIRDFHVLRSICVRCSDKLILDIVRANLSAFFPVHRITDSQFEILGDWLEPQTIYIIVKISPLILGRIIDISVSLIIPSACCAVGEFNP